MRYHAINLIARGAEALAKADDGGTAYALCELANNLRTLMRGEATIEEWNKVYSGADDEPLDLQELFPEPEDA